MPRAVRVLTTGCSRHRGAGLGLLFIDGSHTDASATAGYEGWTPYVLPGGLLAIHDVHLDPAAGGQARLTASTGAPSRSGPSRSAARVRSASREDAETRHR